MNIQPLALHGHMKAVTMVKFNADGDLIFSTAREPGVSVWYAKTGQRLGTYEGNKSSVGCDVNRASTLMITAGSDYQTYMYEVETGKVLAKLDYEAPCRVVAFAHDDGRFFSVLDAKGGLKSSQVLLYDVSKTLRHGVATPKENLPVAKFQEEHGVGIAFASWGPTNDTIYYSTIEPDGNGKVKILDVERLTVVESAAVHVGHIPTKLHFDRNYRTLISASRKAANDAPAGPGAVAPAASKLGGEALLLDSRKLQVIQRYTSDVPVNDASISPCGDHVILGGGMDAQDVTTQGGTQRFEVKFFHKVHGEPLGQIHCHFGTINSVAFAPDGRGFVSGAHDGFVKIFNFDSTYDETPGARPIWLDPENPLHDRFRREQEEATAAAAAVAAEATAAAAAEEAEEAE